MAQTKNKDIEDNKIVAAIGYIFILCLLPLLGKKDSEFAQFHAKQGLVLVICWFIIWVVGAVIWPILAIGNIALLVLSIMGIVNALAGKYWEMPFLGKYAKKIKL
ncbi:MAG: DUF4870 domain-containing protein [bacterium]